MRCMTVGPYRKKAPNRHMNDNLKELTLVCMKYGDYLSHSARVRTNTSSSKTGCQFQLTGRYNQSVDGESLVCNKKHLEHDHDTSKVSTNNKCSK